MSKAGALAATGIGGGGAAVGGYYVFGRGGGNGEATTSTDKPTEQPAKLSNELTPKTLEEFKQNKDIDCIKNYFGELDYENSAAKSISSTDKVETNHFNDGDGEKSCLVVNWEKTDNSSQDNGKWKGNFRWV